MQDTYIRTLTEIDQTLYTAFDSLTQHQLQQSSEEHHLSDVAGGGVFSHPAKAPANSAAASGAPVTRSSSTSTTGTNPATVVVGGMSPSVSGSHHGDALHTPIKVLNLSTDEPLGLRPEEVSPPSYSPKTVAVSDPMSTKLEIPYESMHPTATSTRRNGKPSKLCMLFLKNRCHQGEHCKMTHADVKVVLALRAKAYETLKCCIIHNAPNKMPVHWQEKYLIMFQGGTGNPHPITRLNLTRGLQTFVSQYEQLNGPPPSDQQVCLCVDSSHLCVDRGCQRGEECTFIHLCKELFFDEVPPRWLERWRLPLPPEQYSTVASRMEQHHREPTKHKEQQHSAAKPLVIPSYLKQQKQQPQQTTAQAPSVANLDEEINCELPSGESAVVGTLATAPSTSGMGSKPNSTLPRTVSEALGPNVIALTQPMLVPPNFRQAVDGIPFTPIPTTGSDVVSAGTHNNRRQRRCEERKRESSMTYK